MDWIQPDLSQMSLSLDAIDAQTRLHSVFSVTRNSPDTTNNVKSGGMEVQGFSTTKFEGGGYSKPAFTLCWDAPWSIVHLPDMPVY